MNEETRPHRPQSDLDLVQLSPDMFEPETTNVIFFEELIGTIKQERGIELFKATPYGVTRPITFGFFTQESALCHLLSVRKQSVEKKTEVSIKLSQTSLF